MSARGRVWKSGRAWHYEVKVEGRVVHADNTGAFTPVIFRCDRSARAFDLVTRTGHRIEHTWAELVAQVDKP